MVRLGLVSINVGSVDIDCDGLDGVVIDIVVDLFNGMVRNLVAGLIRDFVTDEVNILFDGLVGSLDILSLGIFFDVSCLDSDELIPLTFGIGFSSLSMMISWMLFGIGMWFHAPSVHARSASGVPLRSGVRRLDVMGLDLIVVAVHESFLNQVFYVLWCGGFFDAMLDSDIIGGVPDGVSVVISTGLSFVAEIDAEGWVRVSVGVMSLNLVYFELFIESIQVLLGACASMTAMLVGEDFDFGDASIDELFFSIDLASLDMSTRDIIEGFLQCLLERILWSAFNDALPVIPISSFILFASVSDFGLPAGALVGIFMLSLAMEVSHVVLCGEL